MWHKISYRFILESILLIALSELMFVLVRWGGQEENCLGPFKLEINFEGNYFEK